jgi:hypothetical protein
MSFMLKSIMVSVFMLNVVAPVITQPWDNELNDSQHNNAQAKDT